MHRSCPSSTHPTVCGSASSTARRRSGLRMAAGMDHIVEGPEGTVTMAESAPDLGRLTVSTELQPGETLRIVKFLSYGWSSQRSLPSLRDQVDLALASAKRTGWKGLVQSQREYLDDMWARADIEVEGAPALQQAVRFALFHVVQAARAGGAPRDSGQGPDRKRLQRPHVLGHGDVHVAGADVRRARRSPRCPLLAALHDGPGGGSCQAARTRGRHLPLAHDPWPGMLGVLAGRHRGVPRQRRHRRCGPPLCGRDR